MSLKRQIFGQGVAEMNEIVSTTMPFFVAFSDAVLAGYVPRLVEWTTAIGLVCKRRTIVILSKRL